MIKIFNEDCLEGMKKIPDGSVDFICTDLPFAITDAFWDKGIDLQKFWQEARRILKPCASAAMFASGNFVYKLHASNAEQYKYKWIWQKNMVTDFVNAKNRPMHSFEEILMFSNGQVAHAGKSKQRMNYYPQGLIDCENKVYNDVAGGGTYCTGFNGKKKDISTQQAGQLTNPATPTRQRVYAFWNQRQGRERESYIQTQTGYPKDVLFYKTPCGVKKVHPNQKPVDLLEYLIRTYTNEGEVVLDATMGSGSTGVACINTGRKFIGFETEKKFFDIAEKRITEALALKQQELF